ncbi:MAG: 50S ribosomal protein L9 [Bacteroidetes bacterium GWE2_42_24]|nr:MAG: 50S ribosomal protein L9 [Bacteroidetes bacterium GWE2_42_24]OFY30604.1 MAG: 50S ribosomal protein L9 [Bacteroidetes bacterium GWF2_43_11]PKP22832.1 MAG: 50S ribosomal protein L9 [Bacteroidetes bacterium HGW-Bacteroidetes-22]
MEVILKQDIANLGFVNDIVSVKNGYANNYLIPQGLAVQATQTNRKILAENLKQRAFKEDKIKQDAQAIAAKLEGIMLRIGAKASTTGKIFGSVNNIQIAEALKEQNGIEIDRRKIAIDGEAVKEVGTYKAKINLHKEVRVLIDFEVIAE